MENETTQEEGEESRLGKRREMMQTAARQHFARLIEAYDELQHAVSQLDLDVFAELQKNRGKLDEVSTFTEFVQGMPFSPVHIIAQVLHFDDIRHLLASIRFHDSILQYILEKFE